MVEGRGGAITRHRATSEGQRRSEHVGHGVVLRRHRPIVRRLFWRSSRPPSVRALRPATRFLAIAKDRLHRGSFIGRHSEKNTYAAGDPRAMGSNPAYRSMPAGAGRTGGSPTPIEQR